MISLRYDSVVVLNSETRLANNGKYLKIALLSATDGVELKLDRIAPLLRLICMDPER